jgi:hypothetical protein
LANWADTPIVAYTAALGAVIVALWTLITLRRA